MPEPGNTPAEIAGFAIIETRFLADSFGVQRKSKQLSDESCSHLSVIARIGGRLSHAVTLRVERDSRDGLPVAGIARPA